MKFYDLAAFALVIIYNLTILVGCAWLVWHGWSGWWFLLAICSLSSIKTGEGGK